MQKEFGMQKNKNQTKSTNPKYAFWVKVLLSLILFFLVLCGLFNRKYLGGFLTYGFMYLFGSYFFMVYLILLCIPLFFILKMKGFKLLHLILIGLGLALLTIGLVTVSSMSLDALNNFDANSDGYILNAFNSVFDAVKNPNTNFLVDYSPNIFNLKGGLLGTSIVASLKQGDNIVVPGILGGLFISFGVCFILGIPALAIIKLIKNKKLNKTYEVDPTPVPVSLNEPVDSKVSNEELQEELEKELPITLSRKKTVQELSKEANSYQDNPNQRSKPFKKSLYDEDELEVNAQTLNNVNNYIRTINSRANIEPEEEEIEEEEEEKPFIQEEISLTRKAAPTYSNGNTKSYTVPIDTEVLHEASKNKKLAKEIAKQEAKAKEEAIIPSPLEDEFEDFTPNLSRNMKSAPVQASPVEKVVEPEQPKVVDKITQHKEMYPNDIIVNIKTAEQKKEEELYSSAEPSEKYDYILPPLSLLEDHTEYGKYEINNRANFEKQKKINQFFEDYKINAKVESFTMGPSVTRFNIRTEPGVRINTIASRVEELQMYLRGDKSVRVETVVEGRDTSGIEVGNAEAMMVPFKSCFSQIQSSKDRLTVILGTNIDGEVVNMNIDDLPHLLVAGSTGSGKSVFIHSLILSLIMRNYPDQLRLILIDPKKVEFTKYEKIPHLFCRIVDDILQATTILNELVAEMERRYRLLRNCQCVNIKEYRKLRDTNKELVNLPDIVCIIDEFADLISQAPDEIEESVQRLAQKARACGIYLVIATQRPSVKVITGDIKANIPARVALSVSSQVDSRTILDEIGAETLVGKGDLLARIPGRKSLIRCQSPYISNEEISRVTTYLTKIGGLPKFDIRFNKIQLDAMNNQNAEKKED